MKKLISRLTSGIFANFNLFSAHVSHLEFNVSVFSVEVNSWDRSLFALRLDLQPCTAGYELHVLFFRFGGGIKPSKEQQAEWEKDRKREESEIDAIVRASISSQLEEERKQEFEDWWNKKQENNKAFDDWLSMTESLLPCEQTSKSEKGCPFDEELHPLADKSSDISIDSRSGKLFDAEKEQNRRRQQGGFLSINHPNL